jgi:hypothetical protein
MMPMGWENGEVKIVEYEVCSKDDRKEHVPKSAPRRNLINIGMGMKISKPL